jgi:uncharacterized protein YcbX
VALRENECLPYDRHWAIAQDGAQINPDAPEWVPCRNFIRGAKAQTLMAVTAKLDGEEITLSHPERAEITLHPERDASTLMDWIRPLYPDNRPAPARVVAAGRGMTDSDFASVSVLNMASLRALSQRAGVALDPRRFRGNIWIDGAPLWDEFDWVGKTLTIGDTRLEVREVITRCRATHGNPDTGRADVDVLRMLETFGHQEFGVYATLTQAGVVALDDAVTLS